MDEDRIYNLVCGAIIILAVIVVIVFFVRN